MPDIKRKRISGIKTINSIFIEGAKAFLACYFGIVEIDLYKYEVKDSYFFGAGGTAIQVNDVTVEIFLIKGMLIPFEFLFLQKGQLLNRISC